MQSHIYIVLYEVNCVKLSGIRKFIKMCSIYSIYKLCIENIMVIGNMNLFKMFYIRK